MGWPFDKDSSKVPDPEIKDKAKDPNAPPEKSPAELIAESVSAALKPMTDQVTALQTQITELTKPRQPKVDEKPPEIASVFDDENTAFNQRIGMAVTPVMARQLELESKFVLSEVKREYEQAGFGDMWKAYESNITKVLSDTPLITGQGRPFRGDPEYIRNTVDMIFGRAAREKGIRFDGKTKSFFLESAGGGVDGHGSLTPEDGLTDAQRRVFQRMGVPIEDAKKTVAKMKFIS